MPKKKGTKKNDSPSQKWAVIMDEKLPSLESVKLKKSQIIPVICIEKGETEGHREIVDRESDKTDKTKNLVIKGSAIQKSPLSRTVPATKITYIKRTSNEPRLSASLGVIERKKLYQDEKISGNEDRIKEASAVNIKGSCCMWPLPTLQIGSKPVKKNLNFMKPAHTLRLGRCGSREKPLKLELGYKTMTIHFDESLSNKKCDHHPDPHLHRPHHYQRKGGAAAHVHSATVEKLPEDYVEFEESESETEDSSESTLSEIDEWLEVDPPLFMGDEFRSEWNSDQRKAIKKKEGSSRAQSEDLADVKDRLMLAEFEKRKESMLRRQILGEVFSAQTNQEPRITYFAKFWKSSRSMTTYDKQYADVLIRKLLLQIPLIEKSRIVTEETDHLKKMIQRKLSILQTLVDGGPDITANERKKEEDKFVEAMNPSTMMGPGEVHASGSKGSKKKPKTKEEKALALLEKQCEKMTEDGAMMSSFMDRMTNWFRKNSSLVTKLFQMVDHAGDGIISRKSFKAGMFDLNCPGNKTEIHMLTKLMDPEDKDEIRYNEINEYLNKAQRQLSYSRHRGLEAGQLILSERAYTQCPNCSMACCEPGYKEKFPNYVNLELRMVTFDKFPKYPGHFTKLVTTNLPVCGVIEIIVQETKTASTKISVFWDKNRNLKACLDPDKTLEECGIKGGSRHEPEQVVLYYDYVTEFQDCALLLCDHYFGQKVTLS